MLITFFIYFNRNLDLEFDYISLYYKVIYN